jgi:hypothetical protein
MNYEYIIIGNSHTYIFNEFTNIFIISKLGASIKGLIKYNSSTNLNFEVLDSLKFNKKSTYIFYLGQCDLEYGYYYKSVLNNTKLDIMLYIDELIHDYELFLKNIPNNIIIMGVNPSVIRDMKYNFDVCFRDKNPYHKDNENGGYYLNYNYDDYKHIFNDSLESININHKLFNNKLKDMCNKNNYKYIDLWDLIYKNDNVLDIYKPIGLDCHINYNNSIYKYLQEKLKI